LVLCLRYPVLAYNQSPRAETQVSPPHNYIALNIPAMRREGCRRSTLTTAACNIASAIE